MEGEKEVHDQYQHWQNQVFTVTQRFAQTREFGSIKREEKSSFSLSLSVLDFGSIPHALYNGEKRQTSLLHLLKKNEVEYVGQILTIWHSTAISQHVRKVGTLLNEESRFDLTIMTSSLERNAMRCRIRSRTMNYWFDYCLLLCIISLMILSGTRNNTVLMWVRKEQLFLICVDDDQSWWHMSKNHCNEMGSSREWISEKIWFLVLWEKDEKKDKIVLLLPVFVHWLGTSSSRFLSGWKHQVTSSAVWRLSTWLILPNVGSVLTASYLVRIVRLSNINQHSSRAGSRSFHPFTLLAFHIPEMVSKTDLWYNIVI